MDGIVIINKEKGVTSRDVVNAISKKLQIKKVGHAGTLDPIATGVLVVGIGKATKILEILTSNEKEYIATVKMGIATDTLDITGQILQEKKDFNISKQELATTLQNFPKEYWQTPPKYSAIKINGKKLYEYARNNIAVTLPQRLVTIKEIELLDYDEEGEFSFRTLVSKGTYIRSLIDDISKMLNVPCTMKDLIRTKSGKFSLNDSYKVTDNFQIIPIKDALNIPKLEIKDEAFLKKVQNGNIVSCNLNEPYILFLHNNSELAIYQRIENNKFKAFKVF